MNPATNPATNPAMNPALVGEQPSAATASGASRAPERAHRRLALLVGINAYRDRSIQQLDGPRNDARLMRDLLIERFGYAPEDIVLLEDAAATHAGIVQAFERHLIAQASADTVAFLFVASHGTQVLDDNGDESDALDEALLVHDSRASAARGFDEVITDDELNLLVARLNQRTPHVTVVADTCHSGSGLRAVGAVRETRVPEAVRERAATLAAERKQRGEAAIYEPTLDYAFISAAASNEAAHERLFEGVTHGALTWHLVKALRQSPLSYTYRDVFDLVRHDVNAVFKDQHPQLEGARADYQLFGTARRPPQPYVSATADGPGHVKLNAGRAQGLTLESRYALYPPGTKRPGGGQALATIEISEVGASSARGTMLSGKAAPKLARAFETERTLHPVKLAVHLMQANKSATLREIRERLRGYAHIVTEPRADAATLVLREEDGLIKTSASTLDVALSDEVRVRPGAAALVVEQVLGWARWYNVLALRNDDPALADVTLELSLPHVPGVRRGAELREGEEFDIVVTNRSQQRAYLGVLDLESNGAVTLVYPDAGSPEYIEPGGRWSKRVKATLPAGAARIRDVIKLMVTTAYSDFGLLEQRAILSGKTRSISGKRSPEQQSDVEKLLAASALGDTRGFVSKKKSDHVERWATRHRTVEVVRGH